MNNTGINTAVACAIENFNDTRRWRIERKNGDILRNVRFAHFTGENGYFLEDRCAIGNMEIGHMIRVDGNAIFRADDSPA